MKREWEEALENNLVNQTPRDSQVTVATGISRDTELLPPASPNIGLRKSTLKDLSPDEMNTAYEASKEGQVNKTVLNNFPMKMNDANDLNRKVMVEQHEETFQKVFVTPRRKRQRRKRFKCIGGLFLMAVILGISGIVIVSNAQVSVPLDNFTGFDFRNRDNVEALCGQNMDPSYAINGVFFVACVGDDAIACVQDSGTLSVGFLDTVACDKLFNKLQCLCTNFVLFTPLEDNFDLGNLCGEESDDLPAECSVPRISVDFEENPISLVEGKGGIFLEMESICEQGSQVQVCLHDGLKLTCDGVIAGSNILASDCTSDDDCICELNQPIFGEDNSNLDLCGSDDERCGP